MQTPLPPLPLFHELFGFRLTARHKLTASDINIRRFLAHYFVHDFFARFPSFHIRPHFCNHAF